MRKGFNGLYGLVRDQLLCDPLSGHLFLFSITQRNRLKILFWDTTGLWVCAKKLERGRFHWPKAGGTQGKIVLSHEEFAIYGLNVQLLALFVADHRRRLATASTHTLLGRAGNHALHARKIRRQRLAARMLALLLVWSCWQRPPLTLCRDFQVADSGLQFQQFQLLAGQLLAARSVLRDPLQAQLLL